MNRRGFLWRSFLGTGGGLAGGCLSRGRTEVPKRRVTSVDAETSVSDVDVRGDVLDPEISADEQGAVRLRFEWSGDEPVVFGFGNDAPVSDPTLDSSPDGLVLTGRTDPEMRRNDETWILQDVPPSTLEYYRPELAPSEAVAGEYYIWGDPEHLNYVEADDYVVRNNVCPYWDGAPSPEEPCESFVIAYSISISESE